MKVMKVCRMKFCCSSFNAQFTKTMLNLITKYHVAHKFHQTQPK